MGEDGTYVKAMAAIRTDESSVPERRHKFWRTPKQVMRALAASGNEKISDPYAKEQILTWLNAAAPAAASKLIEQLVSKDEGIAQKAALAFLEWSVGKPKQQVDGAAFPPLGGRKIEIIITDPHEPKNGNIIDAGAAEGSAAPD